MTKSDHLTTRKKTAQRIKIALGQLNSVLKMVENDDYCIDVINQSRAVQNALREVDYLLLENHLQTCAVKFAKEGKTKESVKEIMLVFRNNGK